MKKYLLSLVIALTCISLSAISQTQKTAPNGCSTDCFFTDCTVSCPVNTIPKCKCVLGSFGSCGCQQMYTKTEASDQLPTPKNQTTFSKVINELNKAGYSAYANNLSALYAALSAKDADSYNRYYAVIQGMVDADASTAGKVQDIIASQFR